MLIPNMMGRFIRDMFRLHCKRSKNKKRRSQAAKLELYSAYEDGFICGYLNGLDISKQKIAEANAEMQPEGNEFKGQVHNLHWYLNTALYHVDETVGEEDSFSKKLLARLSNKGK
jgi:hypothetical protein